MENETATHIIGTLVSEFLSCTQSRSLSAEFADRETANRVCIGLAAQPNKLLWQGLGDRLTRVNAICDRASVKHLAELADPELFDDYVQSCVIPYVDWEPDGWVAQRMRWALAFVRGLPNRDARTLWSDGRSTEQSYQSLCMLTTTSETALFVLIHTLGTRAFGCPDLPLDDLSAASRCAVRLGLIPFAEAFVDERLNEAFRELLAQSPSEHLLPALVWRSHVFCGPDPKCVQCGIIDCRFLVDGFV